MSTEPPFRIRYTTLTVAGEDLHIRSLRDRNQFSDPEGAASEAGISSATWPLFGQLWPSAAVLAHAMGEYPSEGLRILEIGCGLALTSLLLQRQGVDITATDYHPLAGEFLVRNALLNELTPVAFQACDWALQYDDLGQFDVVVGSDLLYERDHPALLAGFIDRHALPDASVVIVDPGRGHTPRFGRELGAFRFAQQVDRINTRKDEDPGDPYRGRILHYTRGRHAVLPPMDAAA